MPEGVTTLDMSNEMSETPQISMSDMFNLMKIQMENQQILIQQLQKSNEFDGRQPSTSREARVISTKDAPKLMANLNLNEFSRWEQRWSDFCVTQHFSGQSSETQVAAFRSCLDDDLVRFLRQGIISVPDIADQSEATVAQLVVAIKSYIRTQQNPLLDRIKFFSRIQDVGESFDEYFASIKELEVACDFAVSESCASCKMSNEQTLRDRLVIGLRDNETRHKLLAISNLSLAEAVTLARAEEAARVTKSGLGASVSTNAVKSSYKKQKQQKLQASNASNQTSSHGQRCSGCGRPPHSNKSECPALNIVCKSCNRKGHFARWCKSSSREPRVSAGRVCVRGSTISGIPVDVQSGHSKLSKIVFRDDTGSDIDVVSPRQLKALGKSSKDLTSVSHTVFSADGKDMSVLGKIPVMLSANGLQFNSSLFVIQGVQEPLLSKSSLKGLGFLPEQWPADCCFVKNIIGCSKVSTTPTPEQVEQEKQKLLSEFADVFTSSMVNTMATEPVDIVLKENTVPFAVYTSRPIPFAYRDQVKSQLDEMETQGVIEKVTEPSEWCHPVVVVDKKGTTEKRLTIDLTKLNNQVKRKVHPSKSPREVLNSITKSKYFSTLDAFKGYWQVPLTERSKALTTFITPWGRYRFLRNTMGYISAGDEFNQRMDKALCDVSNIGKVVDDIIVYDANFSEHVQRLRDILFRCRASGITLSQKKFQFARLEVNFCGYVVFEDGWKVDESKIQAIKEFPVPQNRTDLRSFFGLVQQFAEFSLQISDLAGPLRDNLKEKNVFLWDANHQKAFDAVKSELVKAPVLSFFDPELPTRLETDASRTGLGFVLLQQVEAKWHLVQCGSRFLTDTESRYAMIELELLAIVWAVQKCEVYLRGRDFQIVTDHRPLVPILNSYSLSQIENQRLLRLRMKLNSYSFTAEWQRGKDNFSADALSRFPVNAPTVSDELDEVHQIRLLRVLDVSEQGDAIVDTLQSAELRSSSSKDEEYQSLVGMVTTGFPKSKSDLPQCLLPYWQHQSDLTVEDGIVLKGCRIVVPRSLRKKCLQDLHKSHQGVVRTKQRARQILFWPGINNDVENIVTTCVECCRYQKSQAKEPLIQIEIPKVPFTSTCSDLFSCGGKDWLVYTDRTSAWTCVREIGRGVNSEQVISAFRAWFSELGVPTTLTTDGGPQYSSRKFREFCKTWSITHEMSTPYFPQSNGRAEAAVKSVKTLLKKTATERGFKRDEFHKGLLELRNTPGLDGRSPAQILYGRPLKSFMFASRKSFESFWHKTAEEADVKAEHIRSKAKLYYDKTANVLPVIGIGKVVDMQNPLTKLWEKVGVVVGVGKRRDYHVKVECGKTYWRNRRFLRIHRPVVPYSSTSRDIPCDSTFKPAPIHISTIPGLVTKSPDDMADEPPRKRIRRKTKRFGIHSHKGQSYQSEDQ